MYKVIFTAAYGSGAGYEGTPAHQYVVGRGVGMSRSPKTAVRLARVAAEREAAVKMGDGFFKPVLDTMVIMRGTRVIAQETL